LEILALKNTKFQSISAHSTSAIIPREKSSVITNRKSLCTFQWANSICCP